MRTEEAWRRTKHINKLFEYPLSTYSCCCWSCTPELILFIVPLENIANVFYMLGGFEAEE